MKQRQTHKPNHATRDTTIARGRSLKGHCMRYYHSTIVGSNYCSWEETGMLLLAPFKAQLMSIYENTMKIRNQAIYYQGRKVSFKWRACVKASGLGVTLKHEEWEALKSRITEIDTLLADPTEVLLLFV